MEVMYLLIPLSVLLVLAIVGLFGWALHSGQLEDLEREGERIFDPETPPVDGDQAAPVGRR
ncbi:cbb3-type cytochrome oxidase assembly protein CcoS [Roseateles sp. DAIF2]|uniref:cbb3-type cytochrome oxidase assembly protein CcoS n=1 Tax=Roseateles sp. DAIF2 TaxID=2714952 RepID=UPI0018A2B955|nr:cbb3-type cytochrome oxidase assembly protein CcoS [Roseateles sp. DAIF2]QPF73285.1 cbb3-type cytochrome oxidase assembly protein CcoS [Roseateles sp. DAIF2]